MAVLRLKAKFAGLLTSTALYIFQKISSSLCGGVEGQNIRNSSSFLPSVDLRIRMYIKFTLFWFILFFFSWHTFPNIIQQDTQVDRELEEPGYLWLSSVPHWSSAPVTHRLHSRKHGDPRLLFFSA